MDRARSIMDLALESLQHREASLETVLPEGQDSVLKSASPEEVSKEGSLEKKAGALAADMSIELGGKVQKIRDYISGKPSIAREVKDVTGDVRPLSVLLEGLNVTPGVGGKAVVDLYLKGQSQPCVLDDISSIPSEDLKVLIEATEKSSAA